MAITVTPLTTVVVNSVEARATGIASGINNVAASVVSLLVIALLGTLLGNSPVATARLVMAAAAALALAGAFVLRSVAELRFRVGDNFDKQVRFFIV